VTFRASRFALTLLATAAITAGAVALPASAALPPWTPPADVTGPVGAYVPKLAVAPDGTVTAVWDQFDGVNDIVYSSRFAGGAWSAPVRVSRAATNSYDATVVARPDGSAVAMWEHQTGFGLSALEYSIYSGGTWSAPVEFTDPANSANGVDLVLRPNGSVTAVWSLDTGFEASVQTSTLTGTAWSAVVTLSTFITIYDPKIEVASDGSLVVIWSQGFFPDGSIYASTFTGSSWSAPVLIMSLPATDLYLPELAAASDGTVTAVWNQQVPGLAVHSSSLSGGMWSAPTTLSTAGTGAQVAASGATRAAVWLADNLIQASTGNGTTWSTPVTLSTPAEFADDPQIIATATGFLAIWAETVSGANGVIAVSELVDGTWTPARLLSDVATASVSPQLARDAAGAVTAIWATDEDLTSRIQFSRSAAAAAPGPALAATGTDGAPLAVVALLLLAAGVLTLRRRTTPAR